MNTKRFAYSTLLILLLLSACSAFKAPASTVEPTAEAAVRTAALPMAENILQSLDKNDYSSFLRDMDTAMINAITKDSFTQLQSRIATTYGAYQSVELTGVTLTQGYYSVLFDCKFEKGSLTMRLVLETKAPYLVAGQWFPDMK